VNAKQQRFVAEYLVDLNATQAAIRAGYSAKTAEQQGPRLLGNAEIASAVAGKKATQLDRADLTAVRVLEELRRLVFSNVQDLFDADGNLKPIQSLTREQAACISSLEVIKKNAEAGDGHIDVVHKLKVWDKTRSLEMAAKHFKLLTDVIRVEDEAGLVSKLLEGRKRAAEARKA
jgi:phage terminase small subunit